MAFDTKIEQDNKTLKDWLEQQKAWELIFDTTEYSDADKLKKLIQNWNNFRSITIGLAERTSKLYGEDRFTLHAVQFIEKAKKFFGVNNTKDLPLQRTLVSALQDVTPNTTSALTAGIFDIDFKKTLNEAANKIKKEKELLQIQEEAAAREKIDNAARAFGEHRVHTDNFFIEFRTKVTDALDTEAKRLLDKNPNDERVGLIGQTRQKIEMRINATKDSYRSNYLLHGPNFDDETIKRNCKNDIVSYINTDLVQNPDLGSHQDWSTRFGTALLNIALAIPLFIPVGIKKFATGTCFFNFRTVAQKHVTGIKESAEQINEAEEKPSSPTEG